MSVGRGNSVVLVTMMAILLFTLGGAFQKAMADRYIESDIAGLMDCDYEYLEAAREFEGCETFLLGNECDGDYLRECIHRSRRGDFDRRDRENCYDCNRTNAWEGLVGALAVTAGPVASIFANKYWSNASARVGEARYDAVGRYADALKAFPQACVDVFDSWQSHRSQLGINSAVSAPGPWLIF